MFYDEQSLILRNRKWMLRMLRTLRTLKMLRMLEMLRYSQ